MVTRRHNVFWRKKRGVLLFMFLYIWVACCQDFPQRPTSDHERTIASESNREATTGASAGSGQVTVTDEQHMVSKEVTAADIFGRQGYNPLVIPITKEDAMNSQRTNEFLTSIYDREIRTLTEKYLRLCPMDLICHFSLEYHGKDLGVGKSCCSPCNCNVGCEVRGDCCPPLLPELSPPMPVARDRSRCIDPVVLRQYSLFHHVQGYFMKSTCSQLTGDPHRAYMCTAPYNDRVESLKVSDVVPVTDLTSNTTYRNIHCARCAGLQPDSVSFWQPEIHCSDGPLLVSPEASVMEALRVRYNCYLKNIPGIDLRAHLSDCIASYRETCNETGLWQQYDQFTERACAAFTNNYTIETMNRYIVYRNVFCAVCNGETIVDLCFEPGSFYGGDLDESDMVPFSALLQFTLPDVENAESLSSFNGRDIRNQDGSINDCKINFVYDTHKNVCRPLTCPPFRRLHNDSCVDQYMTMEGVNFEVLLKLVPNSSMSTYIAMDAVNAIKANIGDRHCKLPEVSIKVDYPFQGDTITTAVEEILINNINISHFIVRLLFQQGQKGVRNVDEYVQGNLVSDMSREIEVHEKVYELYVEVMQSDSWYLPHSNLFQESEPYEEEYEEYDLNDSLLLFPSGTSAPALPRLEPVDQYEDYRVIESTSRSVTTDSSSSNTGSPIRVPNNDAANETSASSSETWQDTRSTIKDLPFSRTNREVSPLGSIVSSVDPHDDRVIIGLVSGQPTMMDENLLRCQFEKKPIKLNEQLDCPVVKLTTNDYAFDWVPDGIVVQDINASLSFQDFYSHDQLAIFVCANIISSKTQRHHTVKPIKPTSGHVFAETIVSLICTCCSILCLLVTLTIYCMFPTLRTVPGRNNMMLMATLILAQTLYIVMSVGGIRVDWLCETVGLLLHFFWLSAIFWMGICSFHMFRVFSQIAQQNTEDDKCTFCVYISAVNIAAMLLVVSNIVTAQVTTDGRSIGYGGLLCYISSGKMILFTFGIPVAVVIVTNLVMFVLVVVKIKSLPNVQKNVKRERNTAIIFAKLSTLTGVTWIFGFLAQWTGIVAFTYIFTILNASQGVFLMVSFVCNKRILKMVQQQYRNNPGTSATSFSTTRTTRA